MLTTSEKLESLATLGVELNRVGDLDILMELILSEARRFVNADAGSIYIREDGLLHFSYTQNATLASRLPPGQKLAYNTFTIPIDDQSIAGFVASTGQTLNHNDVYELDLAMPYAFSRQFDDTTGYRTRSMLTVPLTTHRGEVIGVLQIINAKDRQERPVAFSEEDERMMGHFAGVATVALERARMTRAMILRTIRMAEMRDPKETGAHVNRVAAYSVELFERWAAKQGWGEKEILNQKDVFRMAAMMHDVGKVAISDTILKKPGPFSPKEYEIMKQHTVAGARLFQEKQSVFDDIAEEVALNHHERWDGTGYPGHVNVQTGLPLPGFTHPDGRPRGKKGEEIPIFGRIVAIADVFDALGSKRVYKPAWDESKTLAVMAQNRGSHFDPELLDLFFSIMDVIRSIRDRYPEG